MDRYAILLDAGYFFAAGGAELAPGARPRRSELALKDPAGLVGALRSLCDPLCAPASLLRMYWYDAPPRGHSPSSEQETLGRLPGVKLRLGNLNSQGEQKGVDSLIITDLIDLARNAAVSDVVLVSGDEDTRVGVSVAQGYGIKVHHHGIGDVANNTSPRLLMESDGQTISARTWVQEVLEHRPIQQPGLAVTSIPPAVQPVSAQAQAVFHAAVDQAVAEVLSQRTPAERTSLKQLLSFPRTMIPPEYDAALLGHLGKATGRLLDQGEKSLVRKRFRQKVDQLP